MICVIDYGVGNIQSFINLYRNLGFDVKRARVSSDIYDATKFIFPGVGHFDHAMQKFNNSGLRPVLEKAVLFHKVPLLGICVGMQMLASGSDEGDLPGLNWIPGKVKAFASNQLLNDFTLPHMGWNDVIASQSSTLFSKGFDEVAQFYFLHSYYFDVFDKTNVAAIANYGVPFEAAVSLGHIHGVQFHPEKSHHCGEQLLKNFAEM
jgi:glutamine amidotransferase